MNRFMVYRLVFNWTLSIYVEQTFGDRGPICNSSFMNGPGSRRSYLTFNSYNVKTS